MTINLFTMKHLAILEVPYKWTLILPTLILTCLLSLNSNAQNDSTNLAAKMTQMKTTLSHDGSFKVQGYVDCSVYVTVSNGKVSGYVVKDIKNHVIPSSVERAARCRLCWIIDRKKTCVTVPCTDIKIDQI